MKGLDPYKTAILSYLQRTRLPTSGGCSPGLCSRSIRAWPSLLYSRNASFWPGMVTWEQSEVQIVNR